MTDLLPLAVIGAGCVIAYGLGVLGRDIVRAAKVLAHAKMVTRH